MSFAADSHILTALNLISVLGCIQECFTFTYTTTTSSLEGGIQTEPAETHHHLEFSDRLFQKGLGGDFLKLTATSFVGGCCEEKS